MTLADNARGLQGEDDAVLIAEMAAQFGRESELMRDIGYSAEALDRMIASAGDAIISERPEGDPDGREYDESVENDVDSITCPHCGGRVPRG